MVIYTDNTNYAAKVTNLNNWEKISAVNVTDDVKLLSKEFFPSDLIYSLKIKIPFWKHLFITKHASKSQFDVLYKLNTKDNQLPNGILCLADSGNKFHGYRNRAWSAQPGNLHLSVFFSPQKSIEYFHVGFTILTAVSVVQTLDLIPGMKNRAGIKWVNDILIENAKLSGVIAQTQTTGNKVSGVVLGIGLNIVNTPKIESTSFVQEATSLHQIVKDNSDISIHYIFFKLVEYLQKNYRLLQNEGYLKLLEFYRNRSIIIGKNVQIYYDPLKSQNTLIAKGKVMAIGNNLELYLDNQKEPVRSGRLILE